MARAGAWIYVLQSPCDWLESLVAVSLAGVRRESSSADVLPLCEGHRGSSQRNQPCEILDVCERRQMMTDNWRVVERIFNPENQHHKETIFTIGNGYLSTRGVFEEGYPDERRATFIHGVFDEVPLVFTELANVPDWLPLQIYLNGERFSLDRGTIEHFERHLDLRTGVLRRSVSWRSPSGDRATLVFERFASLADEHLLCLRCQITPDF